jgi:excisionase family DNA binding protein
MPDRILVVLPDGRALALDAERYQVALSEGADLSAAPVTRGVPTNEPLVDADDLAALLKVPASWIEQKAREGVIPSLEFGRWRRFRRSEVEAAVRPGSGRLK